MSLRLPLVLLVLALLAGAVSASRLRSLLPVSVNSESLEAQAPADDLPEGVAPRPESESPASFLAKDLDLPDGAQPRSTQQPALVQTEAQQRQKLNASVNMFASAGSAYSPVSVTFYSADISPDLNKLSTLVTGQGIFLWNTWAPNWGFYFKYTATSLPAGISCSSDWGDISGTVTTDSTKTATITLLICKNEWSWSQCTSTLTTPYTMQLKFDIVAPPSGFSYPVTQAYWPINVGITQDKPTCNGRSLKYSISPALPTGLWQSSSTGTIGGTPTKATSASYTTTCSNRAGSVTTTVTISTPDCSSLSKYIYPFGWQMKPDQWMWQCTGLVNGDNVFVLKPDGNLIKRRISTGVVAWSSNSANRGTAPYVFIFQGDGNIVVYDKYFTPTWAAMTNGIQGKEFDMQGDANVVLYDVNGVPRWATMSNGSFLQNSFNATQPEEN